MLCKNPYMNGSSPFGCGQCNPCRFNNRRLKTHRMVLESQLHDYSSFATLTYTDENVPYGYSDVVTKKVVYGHLLRSDYQKFLKRLRKNYDAPIRYFACGEYGEEKFRPHFHFALFGFPPCYYPELNQHQRKKCKCPPCDLIRKSWSKGDTSNDYLTHESAQYIAGYVTKKMTKKTDPRLGGRPPEFGQPSLKPGLGADFVKHIPQLLNGYLPEGDVPQALQHGKKTLPLGRYLTRKLREAYGLQETGAPEGWQAQKLEEVFTVFENSIKDPRNRSKSLKQMLLQENKQKVLNLEAKLKIFSKKGSI